MTNATQTESLTHADNVQAYPAHREETDMEPTNWIEMDDRTSYKVEVEGRVRVSVPADDDVTAEDYVLIAQSLGHRLGGTWTIEGGANGWSAASGEPDITSVWTRK